jgi:carbon-monoxide dehydrogenase large subunit
VKGAGESGVIAAVPAVMSAIENALEPFGVRIAQMPLPPQKLLELISQGPRRAAR